MLNDPIFKVHYMKICNHIHMFQGRKALNKKLHILKLLRNNNKEANFKKDRVMQDLFFLKTITMVMSKVKLLLNRINNNKKTIIMMMVKTNCNMILGTKIKIQTNRIK